MTVTVTQRPSSLGRYLSGSTCKAPKRELTEAIAAARGCGYQPGST